jgi:hypothetical protein
MRREFDAKLRQARRDQAARDERTLTAALGDALAAVRPGREAAVIEVGPDQIHVSAVSLDGAGTAFVRDAGSVAWTSVLPRLPAGERERHAALAAGVAGFNADRIAALVRKLVPPGGNGVLVVCRPANWRVLEAAAEAVSRALGSPVRLLRAAGMSNVGVLSLLADLAAKAPLRRPYYLLTASVDAVTGEVRPRPQLVFAAGATPGTDKTLTLRRMPGDVADTTLAIFAGHGNGDVPPSDWSAAAPLVMYQVPIPAGSDPKYRMVLNGPGQVTIAEPPRARPHPDTWKQVFSRIPARVATASSPVDLVCAIDMAGDMDIVLERKRVISDLIKLLDSEYLGEERLRVAIVTCTDHVFGQRRGLEREPVTSSSELGGAAEALAWLAAAEGVNRSDKHCTPVEDLLTESLDLLIPSNGRGRRPRLVTMAGRPPHPFPQRGNELMACPRGFEWTKIVRELDGLRARYAVVVDDLPRARTPARADWNTLGRDGQYSLRTATARQVAEALGLLAGPNQRIPLPLSADR